MANEPRVKFYLALAIKEFVQGLEQTGVPALETAKIKVVSATALSLMVRATDGDAAPRYFEVSVKEKL